MFLRMASLFHELFMMNPTINTYIFQSLNYISGESFTSLQYQYRIARQTIGEIVPETCTAIYQVLSDEYLKVMTRRNRLENLLYG